MRSRRPQVLEHRQVDLRRADELGDGHELDVAVGAAAGRAVVDGRDAASPWNKAASATTLIPVERQLRARHVLVAGPQRPRERVLGVDRVGAADEPEVELDRAARSRRRSGRAARGTRPRPPRACCRAPSGACRRGGTRSGSGCRSRRRAPRRGSTSPPRPSGCSVAASSALRARDARRSRGRRP